MTATSPAQAFADATSALVGERDVHDILARLVADCLDVLSMDAVGVMVRPQDGPLELLSASSHRAAEIELFQIQADDGPCQDTIRTGQPVVATSADEIATRWGGVGEAIVKAGFESVHAFPMRWQGLVIGGLNLFRATPGDDGDAGLIGQSFADVLSLLVVRSADLSPADVSGRIRQAVAGRAIIEQAKGVLAHELQIDMGESYQRLVQRAHASHETITRTAENIVREAHR
jgi:hypothetical protein